MTKQPILCVDDEPNILDGLKRQLRRDFDVHTAGSGVEALDLIEREGPFAVIMSDYNMPGMDGVEFLRRARAIAPDSVAIMLTGRAELDIAVAALHQGSIFRFLNKPASPEVLIKSIGAAAEHHRLITAERELTARLNQANEELNRLNRQLESRVAERTQTLRRLYNFVSELNGLDQATRVADLAVNTAAKLIGCPLVSLWVREAASGRLLPLAATDPNIVKLAGLPIDDCLAGRVLLERRKLHLYPSAEAAPLTETDRLYLMDFPVLAVPLSAQSEMIGVLTFSGSTRGGFSEEAVVTAHSLAHSTSIALLGHQHRRERDETQDAVIMALAKLSEYRDPETGQHLLRLKIYCRLLCEALAADPKFRDRVTPSFVEDVVRSSPLHDIGKVGIPDHILKKPGRHTPEEFALMKTHAAIGGDTLRSVLEECRFQGFIRTGMDIAYFHHERWDGSGYPQGLQGEAIPLAARILALADVYDALTTARVYKPAFPHDQACAIILEGRGTHFDPDIVAAFLLRERDFAATAASLADAPDCLM